MQPTTPGLPSTEVATRNDGSPEVRLERAAITIGAIVAVLWAAEAIDWVLKHRLDRYGIRPRQVRGLSGILFAPFLHAGFGHLLSNTVPIVILGLLVILTAPNRFLLATLIVTVVSGLGAWLLGASNSVHIGASGVVFGWVGYLLFRGVFSRRAGQLILGVLVAVIYGGMLIRGVLPNHQQVSWQAHLFGAIGGALAAFLERRKNEGKTT